MIRVGITGQSGFVGTHLYNALGLYPGEFERIPFADEFYQDKAILRGFVKQCDVIVHLAAVNRHPDPEVIYKTNLHLAVQLIGAMEAEQATPYVLFSSSTQEDQDNAYGRSKRDVRLLFGKWAACYDASFTGLVIPNVYGPFGRPDYNSFIATFCYKLTHGATPKVLQDSSVRLIYVSNLCDCIIRKIKTVTSFLVPVVERYDVPPDFESKVTEILEFTRQFKSLYFDKGYIPVLKDQNEINLFNTFRSYIDQSVYFPVKLVPHSDARGVFVETIRLGAGGQMSYSTTLPGITRGNHYHTRKIERFIVIKGKARIQLRKIGSTEVLNFFLDGSEPSFVDMPVWYTHNITNIGDDELYTQFWTNEPYDPDNGDTYFEQV